MVPDNFAIGNAAGTVRTMADFDALLKTVATHIRIGSIREFIDPGNDGITYFFDPETRTSYNALGVPDMLAIAGYRELLPLMVEKAHAAGKKVVVSAHAISAEQYARIAAFSFGCGVDEVELNLSCPNDRPASGAKIIPCYDPGYTESILKVVATHCPGRAFEVKVSPITNVLVRDLVKIFVRSDIVHSVVGINTVPNQEPRDENNAPRLSYIGQDGKRHYTGGMGGMAIKDESLRVQEEFVRLLPQKIGYHAVGGIFDAVDIRERIKGRARGVQSATALIETPPFGRWFNEVVQVL